MAVRTVARDRIWWQLGDELSARARSLAYAEAGKRDLRLDFLRGLAVSIMVVDHVGGDSLLTQFSGGNRFIVSAAEGFVFLSGLVLGMVYGDRMQHRGPAEAVRGILHRAATLYKASIGVALAFLALFLVTDLRLWVDRASGFGASDPIAAMVGILTLHGSYHGSDVLVMYTLMISAAPGIIYLLYRGRTALLVAGSVALWALYQRYPEQAAMPWAVANSSFQVAAWQLLFVLGMVAGYHREKVSGWLASGSSSARAAVLGAMSTAALLAWSVEEYGSRALPVDLFGQASYASLFAKEGMGPGRVVAFLAVIVVAFAVVNALWAPLKGLLGWFFLPLGQSSLYVYIMQLFVLVLIYNVAPLLSWVSYEPLILGAQLFGLGLIWIMVRGKFLFGIVPR